MPLGSHLWRPCYDLGCVCRQGKAWSGGDAKAEERLMARLFRLLRCGRLEDARQLCHHVGQPWRAASLGSAGGLGLTPLGKRGLFLPQTCMRNTETSLQTYVLLQASQHLAVVLVFACSPHRSIRRARQFRGQCPCCSAC